MATRTKNKAKLVAQARRTAAAKALAVSMYQISELRHSLVADPRMHYERCVAALGLDMSGEIKYLQTHDGELYRAQMGKLHRSIFPNSMIPSESLIVLTEQEAPKFQNLVASLAEYDSAVREVHLFINTLEAHLCELSGEVSTLTSGITEAQLYEVLGEDFGRFVRKFFEHSYIDCRSSPANKAVMDMFRKDCEVRLDYIKDLYVRSVLLGT